MALVVEKNQEIFSQELEYWLEQLRLEKSPSSDALQLLEKHAESLSSTWKSFTKHLSIEDQQGLNNRDPSWEDVKRVISGVQATWMARKDNMYGAAVARLNKILQTLDAHQAFLKIIPKNDDYASIVCGSLQVLIKASANYRKVAEGLSRAIVEINDIVRLCTLDLRLFKGDHLIEMAALMCTLIYRFLERAMSWYTQSRPRRFINAFKEDAYEEFEGDVAEIRRLSDGIRRRAQQGANIENRLTNLIVQENRQSIREIREQIPVIVQKALDDVREQMLLEVGRNGKLLCIDNAEAYHDRILEDRLQESEVVEQSGFETRKTSQLKGPITSIDIATKTNLTHSARHLRRHSEHWKRIVSAEKSGSIFVDIKVVSSLQEWIPQGSSHFLCIIGPRQTAYQARSFSLAASICSFVTQAGAPLIHTSCLISSEVPQDNLDAEEIALFDLVNSLTAQLIDILPDDFEFNENIPVVDLDGSEEKWALALYTLKILLNASPSPLFCIIDNWQCLENPLTDNEYLTQLLHVFRQHSEKCKSASSPRAFKALITTSGRSVSLMEEFEPQEIVLADSPAAQRTPGRSRPGRSPLTPPSPHLFVSLGVEDDGVADDGLDYR